MLPYVIVCRHNQNLSHRYHNHQNLSPDFVWVGIMGCTVMVHGTHEKKRKKDFNIKSLKDAYPTVAEFHYLRKCIQGRLVVVFK